MRRVRAGRGKTRDAKLALGAQNKGMGLGLTV